MHPLDIYPGPTLAVGYVLALFIFPAMSRLRSKGVHNPERAAWTPWVWGAHITLAVTLGLLAHFFFHSSYSAEFALSAATILAAMTSPIWTRWLPQPRTSPTSSADRSGADS